METKFIDVSITSQQEKKETVFTHYLDGVLGWTECFVNPKDYKEVRYQGRCIVNGDVFIGILDGYIFKYKGIKGDEFNY